MLKLSDIKPSTFRQALAEAVKTPQFIGMVAAPFVGVGATLAQRAYQRRSDAQAKAESYQEMLKLHPHLRDRDPQEVARVFNSIHNASPRMARDPLVAGAWVDNVIENRVPGMNSYQGLLNATKDLSAIQKNVADVEVAGTKTRDNWGMIASNLTANVGQALSQAQQNSLDQQIERARADVAKNQELYRAERDRNQRSLIEERMRNTQKADELGRTHERRRALIDRAKGELQQKAHELRLERTQFKLERMADDLRSGRRKHSSARPELARLFAALKV